MRAMGAMRKSLWGLILLLVLAAVVVADESRMAASNFFTRATTAFQKRQYGRAEDLLDHTLKLYDFKPAYKYRAEIYLRQGRYEAMAEDLSKSSSDVSELTRKMNTSQAASKAASSSKDPHAAISHLDTALKLSPDCVGLRVKRAELYIGLGDHGSAVLDLKRASRLSENDSSLPPQLARAQLAAGDLEPAYDTLKSCLTLDPEAQECKSEFKGLKKFLKPWRKALDARDRKRWNEAARFLIDAQKASEMFWNTANYWQTLGECYSKKDKHKKAFDAVNKAIEELGGRSTELYLIRGEALLALEKPKEALGDFQTARAANQSDSRAQNGYARAEKAVKMLERKDYYKILGVSKSATGPDIKRAYKKLARAHHPDTFQDPEKKAEAEARFMDIGEAYSVLKDDQKRRAYDTGADLNGHGGGGGGRGGGGGFHGFQQNFNFNGFGGF